MPRRPYALCYPVNLQQSGTRGAWTSFPAVNSLGCVKVLTNCYSVPLQAGTQVQAKVYARFVELEGRCVARHERCYGRHQQVLEVEQYLDVLSRKPGALAGSRPLEQQRQAGLWRDSSDQIWHSLMMRHGKQSRNQRDGGTAETGQAVRSRSFALRD